jgi:hypothetical protein
LRGQSDFHQKPTLECARNIAESGKESFYQYEERLAMLQPALRKMSSEQVHEFFRAQYVGAPRADGFFRQNVCPAFFGWSTPEATRCENSRSDGFLHRRERISTHPCGHGTRLESGFANAVEVMPV